MLNVLDIILSGLHSAMDEALANYQRSLQKRAGLRIPAFAKEAVHSAPILALLETPGNSGAQRSGIVTIDNSDPTAKRLRKIICRIGIGYELFVCWNFYAAYRSNRRPRHFWAKEIERLVNIMPRLSVVIVLGNRAWLGMRDVTLRRNIVLIGGPHPSNRAINRDSARHKKIVRVWKRAHALIKEERLDR